MQRAQGKLSGGAPVRGALAALLVLCSSCDQGPAHVPGAEAMKQPNIVAGPGEPTLAERYHVTIRLPMPERDFIGLLRRLNLHFELCGGAGTPDSLPPPRWTSAARLTNAIKCYDIYGDVDQVRHVGESYRAFLDNHDQVIYIENIFAYTGP